MNPHYKRYRGGGGSHHASKSWLGLGVLVLGVFLTFGGIVWFRKSADQLEIGGEDDSTSTTGIEVRDETAPTRRSREEVLLTDTAGGSQTIVSREIEDRVFRLAIVSHLSDPPVGQFYEGWLLREDPFDFFSAGAMVKNADGTYALVWEGPRGKDFADFTNIIITRELPDGDSAPSSVHVLEGSF